MLHSDSKSTFDLPIVAANHSSPPAKLSGWVVGTDDDWPSMLGIGIEGVDDGRIEIGEELSTFD